MTIDRVALASGVGRPTIYRTWSNAHELAMAAFLAGPQVEFARPRRGLLLQGVRSGELRPIEDVDTVPDLIYGPLFYRLLAGHLPLQPAFAQRIVDTLCEGIAAK